MKSRASQNWCQTHNNGLIIIYQFKTTFQGLYPQYTEKTTDLLQVTDKLSHIILYLVMGGIRTHNVGGESH